MDEPIDIEHHQIIRVNITDSSALTYEPSKNVWTLLTNYENNYTFIDPKKPIPVEYLSILTEEHFKTIITLVEEYLSSLTGGSL